MINSFTTSMELYRAQYADSELIAAMNVLAIKPYGHGATRATWQQFTYWDSAIADLQVLEVLGIPEAFVLGTSQGGWIAARMAMLAPDKVKGIIVLGTSMDDESQRSRDLGCWDGDEFCTPTIEEFSAPVGDDWVVTDDYVTKLLESGLGDTVTPEEHAFWLKAYRANYTGDAGRKRILVSAINLRDRDGCTRASTPCSARSFGCTAARIRCTRSPMRARRSRCSPTRPLRRCASWKAANTS